MPWVKTILIQPLMQWGKNAVNILALNKELS